MSWEPPFSTGTDGAEPTGLRRLLRQPAARRNLMVVAGVAGAVLLWMPRGAVQDPLPPVDFETHASPSAPPLTSGALDDAPDAMLGTPAPAAGVPSNAASTQNGEIPDRDKAVYTIYLHRLPGLAPDSQPGTSLDIWVTWKPPLTEQPKVQLLLEGVQLGRIEAGFEQGPVADLLVDERDVPDLIYGERFGSFNVVARPG